MHRQDPLASLLCLVQAALFICRKFCLADSPSFGLSFYAVPIDTTRVVLFNLASSLTGRTAIDTLCTFALPCIVTTHVKVHHVHPRTGVTEEQMFRCLSSTSSRGHLVQLQFLTWHMAMKQSPKIPLWIELQAPERLLRWAGLCLCYLKDCAVRLEGSDLPYPEHHHLLQVLDCPQHLEPWHLLRISLAQQIHF